MSRQLREALDASGAGPDGWAAASSSHAQQQLWGGGVGAAALERLRRVRALARRLATGHSPAMRRMLPPALLSELASAEAALAT